jgi:translocation and assembly module TamB
MRRSVGISARVLGGAVALVLLLAAILLVAGNTPAGRVMIETATARLTAGQVNLSGLGGSFPTQLTLAQLELCDRRGVWLRAEHLSLRWSPLRLLERLIQVDDLRVARLDIERAPLPEPGGGGSIPHIDVSQFSIDTLKLGSELAGAPATLSIRGRGKLRSLEDASAAVAAHRVDGDGQYTLNLRLDPARIDATLELHEPAGGPLENILQLPGLGALSADLSVAGPRNAERIDMTLRAGELRARAKGTVDIAKNAAELDYSLEAPAMSPRPGIAWRRLVLDGRWHGDLSAPAADGRLEVDALQLEGGTQVAGLRASLAASSGSLSIKAIVTGLEIPGSRPKLFAADPLSIDASLRLDRAERPLVLTATHRFLSLRAQAVTAGRRSASLDIRVPDVAPFARLVGQDVRGEATITAQLARRPSDVTLTMAANVAIAGGTADWISVVGNRMSLQVAGALSDDKVSIERLKFDARALTFSLSGGATRLSAANPKAQPNRTSELDHYIDKLEARWNLDISDLAILAPQLTGVLQASGHLSGPPSSLAADAELSSTLSIRGSPPGTISAQLRARGLPAEPSGTVQARGVIDGAPLKLDATLEGAAHHGLRAVVRQADWKSAHIEGAIDLGPALADSRGEVHLRLEHLSDLDRFLGHNLEGSLQGNAKFTPAGGRTRAELELDGRDLVAGQFSGNLKLVGNGPTDALALELTAQAPDLNGAAASVSSSALLNLEARELSLAKLIANYRGEEFKLQAPAHFSFANGMSVDRLTLGARKAVLEIAGEMWPALDIHASLHQLKRSVVNVFVPNLLSQGTIEGQLRLQGTLAAPTGNITLDATGMRASDETAGLPGIDLHAKAELDGNVAAIDARFSAQSSSSLTVSGVAPLRAGGVLDIKIFGKGDFALVNQLLEARGMHAEGQLTADATVTGQTAAPQIRGTITLAQGSFRDYVHGANLSNISAEITGSESMLQIKAFKANAASGTVAMTGTIGVLQPGIPLDLKITASKAEPISSNIVTANLDANVHISGTARERIEVGGKIHVNRATIGIPDALPPNVAVLDVRRRGRHTPPPAGRLAIGLDLGIEARQILVQGRGLDAELGGELHIRGTAAEPEVSGGFDLVPQRGSFTIASSKLTFTSGRVSFDSAGLRKAIDPTLDFTAQATVPDATVTLQISGHADSPTFDFSSSPPGMPQDEILGRLLFGVPAAQLSVLQVAQIGAAVAKLSGVGGGSPLVRLQRSLGLDRLSVGANTTTTATGATENSGAAIAAGRYLSKRVYVEGKQTTTGTSQVQVDVDLTKHLKLQTRVGNGTAVTGTTPENDPGSSIGLSYQIEY